MIDWWGVFHNTLWIAGLAISLATFSLVHYSAQRDRVRLRVRLAEPGFQLALCLGLALSCLGLSFSSRALWEHAAWGLLAALFAAQAAWAGWRLRASRPRPTPQAGPRADRRRASRAVRRLGWGLVAAGLLVLIAWATLTGVQVLRCARSLQANLTALEGTLQAGTGKVGLADLEAAGRRLGAMHQDLEALQAEVGPLLPLARLLGWAPHYGGDLAAAPNLFQVALQVSAAGDGGFRAVSPALDLFSAAQSSAAPEGSLAERLVPVLVAAQPELQLARLDLAAAQQARSPIDAGRLSPRVAEWLARLDRYLPWFEAGIDAGLVAPSLLGVGDSRTYLVLAQNSDELRPTGGFISGVGELTMQDGRVASLSFKDSYAVDNLQVPHDTPPPDLQRVLFGQLLFFRDTNWDPDFPTSALRAMEVYARDQGVRPDGVIALDLTALHALVDALGPLQVEGIAEPVTGQNVLQVLQQQWGSPEAEQWQQWWAHRKDFMGPIAGAAMQRLVTGQGVDVVRLVRALGQVLEEKHLLVYPADPEAAALLHSRNWDGALQGLQAGSDWLMVVDTNVGFNKVDPNVERTIQYEVDLSDESQPRARLILTYRNKSPTPVAECVQEARYDTGQTYTDLMDGCFWDYLRVYVPTGSALLSGPDPSLPAGSLLARSDQPASQEPISQTLTSGLWPVWTAFFDLAPGQERSLTFEYELPAWVLDYRTPGRVRYQLYVQKQPGTEAVPLQVRVLLPPGGAVVNADPADLGTMQLLTTDLRTDRELDIVYRTGGNP